MKKSLEARERRRSYLSATAHRRRRQRQRVSAGLGEGATRLLISCPSSHVCGNARRIRDLGPRLLSYSENGRTDAQTFLQPGLRCTALGAPAPSERRFHGEWSPGF
ncbi:unnamed protein product [Pipistrellus nathusii]|uniref:Uncharacterized protein n=1 Tax=Pipistrellus nathusii TaxID=59473 RepID=A0ABN9ZM17_PIPNA